MESSKRGEHVVAAFLDVEKAVDNVLHNGNRYKIFQSDLPTKMTRWLSDFLVGRVKQVGVNGLLSNQINPKAGFQRVLSWVHYFFWFTSTIYQHRTTNKIFSSSSLMILHNALSALKTYVSGKIFSTGPSKLGNVVRQMENQTKSPKTKVIIFWRSILARKTEPNLKLYGETLKVYPQVKFLGINFNSKLNFKKYLEDILDLCNARYHRLRLLANKNWEPSPSTLIQIYKQCVRPIFEYGSFSTITTSDHIISKIQWLQHKCIQLALHLPKYIRSKLLHGSYGLPYVKGRLLSCVSKSLDRIAQNPPVEQKICSNRLNPAWDCFPTPLSVVRPVSL